MMNKKSASGVLLSLVLLAVAYGTGALAGTHLNGAFLNGTSFNGLMQNGLKAENGLKLDNGLKADNGLKPAPRTTDPAERTNAAQEPASGPNERQRLLREAGRRALTGPWPDPPSGPPQLLDE